MLGFLLVSDRDTVMFVDGCGEFRKVMLEKQRDYSDANTSGFSEGIVSSNSKGSSLGSPRESVDSLKVKKKKPNEFDLNALTQYFLPMIILQRTKCEFDQDSYLSIKSLAASFRFENLGQDFFLIVLSSVGRSHMEKSYCQRYINLVKAAMNLAFGPVLSHLASLKPARKCFKKLLSAIHGRTSVVPQSPIALSPTDTNVPKIPTSKIDEISKILNAEDIADSIDVNPFIHPNQAALAQDLAFLAQQFEIYLSCSMCLLFHNRKLVGAHRTSVDEKEAFRNPKQLLTATDLKLLIEICRVNKPSFSAGSRPKLGQLWLVPSTPSSDRLPSLWDYYSIRFSDDFDLVCLSQSENFRLLSSLSQFLLVLGDLSGDVGSKLTSIEAIIAAGDSAAKSVGHLLLDIVPDDSTRSGDLLRNLHRTAQMLTTMWYQTKMGISFALAKSTSSLTTTTPPPTTSPHHSGGNANNNNSPIFHFPVEIQAHLDQLRRQLRNLAAQLVQRSAHQSREYRSSQFVKCWERLNRTTGQNTSVDSGAPSPTHLQLHAPSHGVCNLIATAEKTIPMNGLEATPATAFGLDARAYFFCDPIRNTSLHYIEDSIRPVFLSLVETLLSRERQSAVSWLTTVDEDLFIVCVVRDAANISDRRREDQEGTTGAYDQLRTPAGHYLNDGVRASTLPRRLTKRSTKLKGWFSGFGSKQVDRLGIKTGAGTAISAQRSIPFAEVPPGCLCITAFNHYVNRDLAVNQTRQLVAQIYTRVSRLKWSFG